MQTPSNYDYQQYTAQMKAVESAPLNDRKEARAEWLEALQNSPELIAERVDWLIDGSYGYVSYYRAKEIIHNTRMNRTAALGQMIAALEWQCPNAFARGSWNKLTEVQKDAVTTAINDVITAALEAEKAEA